MTTERKKELYPEEDEFGWDPRKWHPQQRKFRFAALVILTIALFIPAFDDLVVEHLVATTGVIAFVIATIDILMVRRRLKLEQK